MTCGLMWVGKTPTEKKVDECESREVGSAAFLFRETEPFTILGVRFTIA